MPGVDRNGRWTLPAVALMAEEEIKKQRSSHLVEADLELLRAHHGCIMYGYPKADWEALIGESADKDETLEVGLGIGDPDADPDGSVRVVVLALASRRPENPFIKLVWYPESKHLYKSE